MKRSSYSVCFYFVSNAWFVSDLLYLLISVRVEKSILIPDVHISDKVVRLFMQIWDELSSCVNFQQWIRIKYLLKFHIKNFKVPSICPIELFFLFVCFSFFCLFLLPSFLLSWDSLYELENLSGLTKVCSFMSVMTCKSFWWPQTL